MDFEAEGAATSSLGRGRLVECAGCSIVLEDGGGLDLICSKAGKIGGVIERI